MNYTIGDLREDTLQNKYEAPTGTPKQRMLECLVQEAVIEGNGFESAGDGTRRRSGLLLFGE